MKQYFSTEFFKGLGRYFYDSVLYPFASEYVKKTENTYDDAALLFLNDLVKDFLGDKK